MVVWQFYRRDKMAPFNHQLPFPRLYRYEEPGSPHGGGWSSGSECGMGRWLRVEDRLQEGHEVDVFVNGRGWLPGKVVALQNTRVKVRIRQTRIADWVPLWHENNRLVLPAGMMTEAEGRRNLPADFDVRVDRYYYRLKDMKVLTTIFHLSVANALRSDDGNKRKREAQERAARERARQYASALRDSDEEEDEEMLMIHDLYRDPHAAPSSGSRQAPVYRGEGRDTEMAEGPPEDPTAQTRFFQDNEGRVVEEFQMDSDGNCLFRAVSHQVYGTPDHHALVRAKCVEYLRSERAFFSQFVAGDFDQYLDKLSQDGEWGDDVEIEAFSEIYGTGIEIYGYGTALLRTFHENIGDGHRLRLAFRGGAHYNSLLTEGVSFVRYRNQQEEPGEIEAGAIARSQRNRPAAAQNDELQAADRDLLQESITQSRQQFETSNKQQMEQALQQSLQEWERTHAEQAARNTESDIMQAVMKETAAATEQKENDEMRAAIQASLGGAAPPSQEDELQAAIQASLGSAAPAQPRYPDSVMLAHSMGYPLELCQRAYDFLGADDVEVIEQFCLSNIGQ